MKERMISKLRSRSGETLAETLIAVLISALAALMLTGAITSAKRAVDINENVINRYYAVNNAMVERKESPLEEEGYTGELTVTIKNDSINLTPATSVNATYYQNNQFPGRSVIAYTYSKED